MMKKHKISNAKRDDGQAELELAIAKVAVNEYDTNKSNTMSEIFQIDSIFSVDIFYIKVV